MGREDREVNARRRLLRAAREDARREKLSRKVAALARKHWRSYDGEEVAALTETIDSVWRLWPRTDNKHSFVLAMVRLRPDSDEQEEILRGAELQRQVWVRAQQEVRFIPYAATWINQRRWEDFDADDNSTTGTVVFL